MEHSRIWTIEQEHGSDWTTSYGIEIFGEINPGSRGDRVTPGESAFVDGDIRIEVREAVDYRFGDRGVPLDLFEGEVSDAEAGRWLLKQLSEDEIEELKDVLLDHWRDWQVERSEEAASY